MLIAFIVIVVLGAGITFVALRSSRTAAEPQGHRYAPGYARTYGATSRPTSRAKYAGVL